MKRPILSSYSGYTLIEILVSTALALLLLTAVITIFGNVSESISESRSMLESAEQLRLASTRLQQDLAGVTVTMSPPRKPENNEGYFEYIEGPITPATASTVAVNSDSNVPDTTVGDVDDILMFTTRSTGRPFVGKCGGNPIQSDVAEVAWFVRGRTLYRRVMLVAPAANLAGATPAGFYASYDVSARLQGGGMVANTLGDLTRRESRFAHQTGSFPFSPYVSSGTWTNGSNWSVLRLPTLCECSSGKHLWTAGGTLPDNSTITLTSISGFSFGQFDAWRNPLPYQLSPSNPTPALDKATGAHNYYYTPGAPTANQRTADDVILNNVIGFDVKAWDPNAQVLQKVDNSVAPPIVSLVSPDALDYATAAVGVMNGGGVYTVGSLTYTRVGYGAYVDLGYLSCAYTMDWDAPSQVTTPAANGWIAGTLGHRGHPKSGMNAAANGARVYDTWSTHYEAAGTFAGDTRAGRALNGIDDQVPSSELPPSFDFTRFPNGVNGIVDDVLEQITSPPYPVPLRGIQVKIRIFEPDSRQVREVTVVQDFRTQ